MPTMTRSGERRRIGDFNEDPDGRHRSAERGIGSGPPAQYLRDVGLGRGGARIGREVDSDSVRLRLGGRCRIRGVPRAHVVRGPIYAGERQVGLPRAVVVRDIVGGPAAERRVEPVVVVRHRGQAAEQMRARIAELTEAGVQHVLLDPVARGGVAGRLDAVRHFMADVAA